MSNLDEGHAIDDDAESLRLLQAYQDALQSKDVQTIEASADALFMHACAQMQTDPPQDLLWKQEAHEHEAAHRWAEAEAAYLRCLTLAQTQNETAMEYMAHSKLSRLHQFLGQSDRAAGAAQASVEAARRSGMETLLLMALEDRARCYLDAGAVNEALWAAEEMRAILKASTLQNLHGLSKARTLTLRARCFALCGDTAAAERDLDDALPLLTPLSAAPLFAGVQSGLANWWAVCAQIKARHSDTPAARQAWQKSVDYARLVSQAEQLDGPYKYAGLARTLQKQADFLHETGDTTGAGERASQEARAIRAAIGQPDSGV